MKSGNLGRPELQLLPAEPASLPLATIAQSGSAVGQAAGTPTAAAANGSSMIDEVLKATNPSSSTKTTRAPEKPASALEQYFDKRYPQLNRRQRRRLKAKQK